jgi:hypothetical protein
LRYTAGSLSSFIGANRLCACLQNTRCTLYQPATKANKASGDRIAFNGTLERSALAFWGGCRRTAAPQRHKPLRANRAKVASLQGLQISG